MSGHTPGRLKHLTGYPMDIVGPDGQYTFAKTYLVTTLDNAEANARRLVACWNALDGIPTTEIESAAQSGSISYALAKVIANMVDQRDKLLHALTVARKEAVGWYDECRGFADGKDAPPDWLVEIDAAIAKVEP